MNQSMCKNIMMYSFIFTIFDSGFFLVSLTLFLTLCVCVALYLLDSSILLWLAKKGIIFWSSLLFYASNIPIFDRNICIHFQMFTHLNNIHWRSLSLIHFFAACFTFFVVVVIVDLLLCAVCTLKSSPKSNGKFSIKIYYSEFSYLSLYNDLV